jgi:hypothetical protein
MNETEALNKMIAPGQRRATKWREGVIQIWVTRACDKSCFGCTQGSNLGGKLEFMSPDHFRQAVLSLQGYFGVVGVFGGNPALSPHFAEYCKTLRELVPFEQRGLWCNHPKGKGKLMQATFNPQYSNLNVHLDQEAFKEFKRDWPECMPCGVFEDSRHSPPYVAMKDVIADEAQRWELISGCDINRYWSAMIGLFRGQLRAYFCEIAGAQAMLHQHEQDYPDTGLNLSADGYHYGDYDKYRWWTLGMPWFSKQVKKHCHECGVPLRGKGELAVSHPNGTEQVSQTHANVYKPKRVGRSVQLITTQDQLGGCVTKVTDYIGNSKR